MAQEPGALMATDTEGTRPNTSACCSSFFMPTPFSLSSALDFIRVGIETNLWGLACPFHCGPPSSAALGLAFLSGFGLGFGAGLVLVIFLAFRFGLHPQFWGPGALRPLVALGLRQALLPA